MKIYYKLFLLALFWSIIGCKQNDNNVEHVILISLDGSRPEFYMDTTEWDTPVLQRLKNKGVYASKGIKSIFPSLTYPAHTSIITGANPIHHQIYFNKPFGAEKWDWYWEFDKINGETIWDAVKNKKLTSGSVFWPVTVGAPIDYNFPSRNPKAGEEGNLLTIKYPFITPKSLLDDIENRLGVTFTEEDLSYEDYKYGKTVATISNYIIKEYKPNLMALRFFAIDHFSHTTGANSLKTHEAVRVTDSLVGTVLNAVKEAGIQKNTVVIITGDHGHTDTKGIFSPNVYLVQNGIITKNDWRAQFYSGAGSGFLYLKNKTDTTTVDEIVRILKSTPEYENGYFRILNRKELDEMGADANASLALSMKEGFIVNDAIEGPTLVVNDPPYTKSTHGYDPEYQSMKTSFIAVGPGIKENTDIKDMSILDIAPLISELLGLDFDPLDGRFIENIITKSK